MMITAILVILVSFFVGYIAGKRHGWASGYHEAESVVPLEIRRQSLEKGKCVICDEWIKAANYEIVSEDLDTFSKNV